MASVNKVILVGRLGKDIDLRQTGAGSSIANMTLATDRRYKDAQGIERYATDIIGETLQFLDSKKCAGKSNVRSTNLRKPAPANNEDVPF